MAIYGNVRKVQADAPRPIQFATCSSCKAEWWLHLKGRTEHCANCGGRLIRAPLPQLAKTTAKA